MRHSDYRQVEQFFVLLDGFFDELEIWAEIIINGYRLDIISNEDMQASQGVFAAGKCASD